MSSASEDDLADNAGLEDDLFGDESGDEVEQPTKTRELSDQELDSGDDEGRSDREPEKEDVDYVSGRDARVLDQTIWRHPLPKPADGEVRLNILRGSINAYLSLVQQLALAQIPRHRPSSL